METKSRYLLGPREEMSPLQTQRGSSGDLSGDLLRDLSGPGLGALASLQVRPQVPTSPSRSSSREWLERTAGPWPWMALDGRDPTLSLLPNPRVPPCPQRNQPAGCCSQDLKKHLKLTCAAAARRLMWVWTCRPRLHPGVAAAPHQGPGGGNQAPGALSSGRLGGQLPYSRTPENSVSLYVLSGPHLHPLCASACLFHSNRATWDLML